MINDPSNSDSINERQVVLNEINWSGKVYCHICSRIINEESYLCQVSDCPYLEDEGLDDECIDE